MLSVKKIEVAFFQTSVGAVPVRQWLREMPKEERALIGEDIRTVEYGWPIGMPVCRPLGSGLYEVRSNLRESIARTIFAIEGRKMVLLHGFIKKTQKTPKAELDLAHKRWKQYRSGKE